MGDRRRGSVVPFPGQSVAPPVHTRGKRSVESLESYNSKINALVERLNRGADLIERLQPGDEAYGWKEELEDDWLSLLHDYTQLCDKRRLDYPDYAPAFTVTAPTKQN